MNDAFSDKKDFSEEDIIKMYSTVQKKNVLKK
jgi:hypothetical protein